MAIPLEKPVLASLTKMYLEHACSQQPLTMILVRLVKIRRLITIAEDMTAVSRFFQSLRHAAVTETFILENSNGHHHTHTHGSQFYHILLTVHSINMTWGL